MSDFLKPTHDAIVNSGEMAAWATADPESPQFKDWLRKRYDNFKQTDPDSTGISEDNGVFVHPLRFLQETLGFLKSQPDISDDVIYNILQKIAALKVRIENQRLQSEATEREIKRGKSIVEVLNNEISEVLGKRFDAHGITKSNQLLALIKILDHGIDPSKPFHTASLKMDMAAGIALGSNRGGATADGGFMLVSGIDRNLVDGVKVVIVNWQYRDAVSFLSEKYPQITFVLPEDVSAVLDKMQNDSTLK